MPIKTALPFSWDEEKLNRGRIRRMPYATNSELPDAVRRHLPPHAQSIYRAAFNRAYMTVPDDLQREQSAHRIAWGAVKRAYVKVGTSWIPRALVAPESLLIH